MAAHDIFPLETVYELAGHHLEEKVTSFINIVGMCGFVFVIDIFCN